MRDDSYKDDWLLRHHYSQTIQVEFLNPELGKKCGKLKIQDDWYNVIPISEKFCNLIKENESECKVIKSDDLETKFTMINEGEWDACFFIDEDENYDDILGLHIYIK